MLAMKKATKRRCTVLAQVTCASALPSKTGNTKLQFLFALLVHCQKFNQSLLDVFNLFDSRLMLMLLYDSLNHVLNA